MLKITTNYRRGDNTLRVITTNVNEANRIVDLALHYADVITQQGKRVYVNSSRKRQISELEKICQRENLKGALKK